VITNLNILKIKCLETTVKIKMRAIIKLSKGINLVTDKMRFIIKLKS